jgi:hypothetical protein
MALASHEQHDWSCFKCSLCVPDAKHHQSEFQGLRWGDSIESTGLDLLASGAAQFDANTPLEFGTLASACTCF